MRRIISIDFPAPEMEPESAHVVSAISIPLLQCGDLRCSNTQATFILRYSAPLRYSMLCFNSITQLTHIENASLNVRTQPQSEIGRNRGKKRKKN